MKYLVIDASLNGTGIRDYYEGGYIAPEDLSLAIETIHRLKKWLISYENEHYNSFNNKEIIDELDREGKEIALLVKNELPEAKIEYFSDARMLREMM